LTGQYLFKKTVAGEFRKDRSGEPRTEQYRTLMRVLDIARYEKRNGQDSERRGQA
jgi:hypothetical protein